MSFIEYLDALYLEHGYYQERTLNLYYEGAAGSEKIQSILKSYRFATPSVIGDIKVKKFTDFGQALIQDADGDNIPPQDFYFLELENGYSYAVRGSGTEPKIKFYVFGRTDVADASALPSVKTQAAQTMQSVLDLIEADARLRAEPWSIRLAILHALCELRRWVWCSFVTENAIFIHQLSCRNLI